VNGIVNETIERKRCSVVQKSAGNESKKPIIPRFLRSARRKGRLESSRKKPLFYKLAIWLIQTVYRK